MDRSLIDQYEHGGEKLKLAIAGLTREDLLAMPAPDGNVGKWSIQQVVLHLTDSDVIWAARMKTIIAEDHPTIIPFDQDLFATKLFYDEQSAVDAVALFDLNRRMLGTVLKQLPESAFARTGKHVERGQITLAQCVQFMTEHLEHHLKFIHAKREAMGKEMW